MRKVFPMMYSIYDKEAMKYVRQAVEEVADGLWKKITYLNTLDFDFMAYDVVIPNIEPEYACSLALQKFKSVASVRYDVSINTIKRSNPLINAGSIIATLPLADAFSLIASPNGREDIAYELIDLMKRLDD